MGIVLGVGVRVRVQWTGKNCSTAGLGIMVSNL